MGAILDSKWTGWFVFFCIAVACGKGAFMVWALAFTGYLCYRLVRGAALAVRRPAEYSPQTMEDRPVRREISDAECERIRERAAADVRGEFEAHRRREEARARVEITYRLHAPELGERLPWAVVQDFLDRYVNEYQSPENAERRAQQLIDVIEGHLDKVSPPADTATVGDVLADYEEKLRKIDEADLEEEWRDTLRTQLRERAFNRLQQVLEGK